MGKRSLFNIIGILIIGFWGAMMLLLYQRVESNERSLAKGKIMKPRIGSFEREWKEIFYKGKKVGYSVSLIKPVEDDYIIQEDIYLRLQLGGLPGNVHTITQCRVDKNFYLKEFNFSMSSGVVKFYLKGRVEGKTLIIQRGGKNSKAQRIPLKKRPVIGSAVGAFFKINPLTPDKTYRFPIFDPSTMTQTEATFKVVGREKIIINGIPYNATRIETVLFGKPVRFWIDEDGSTLKEEGFMDFTIVRSSPERAPKNLEAEDREDFYDAMAVGIDRPMPAPRRLKSIRLRVKVEDKNHGTLKIPTDHRQIYRDGILRITKESIPRHPSYEIPYQRDKKEIVKFLRPEFNIESDNQELRDTAHKIIGNTTNPILVCGKLMKWVNENIKKMPVVVVPSAVEVLRTKVGDCNEHSTLLTAFLRAVGVPSRISVGLVYSRNRFYYHAWNEAYVGKWITMDATMNQMPADPSHIKLAEGSLDKQIDIAPFIGAIKFKLLNYEYD